jgi:SPP1 gp7 family putative phage head morphogenesis protein
MPVHAVTVGGVPGYRWGTTGKVHTYRDEPGRLRALDLARRQPMADAEDTTWKIDRNGAPSPRAYMHLVNRWIRAIRRQILAALGAGATADAEPASEMGEAASMSAKLATLRLVPLTPTEIEGVGKPAARQSMRSARKQVISAGVSQTRLSERLGIHVEELIGIDVAPTVAERAALTAWAKEGTDLISTVGQEIVAGLDAEIMDAARRGLLTKDLRKIVSQRLGIGARHAQFIARDQIAKLNSKITESTQKAAGIESYKWRSSRDQRTRERHRELDGTIHRWDDPPVVDPKTGRRDHPGEDYQCRCVAIPVVDLDDDG